MTNEETSANRLSSSLIGDLPALDKIRQEFCLLLVTMTPSTVTSSTILDLFSTDNETFLALWRIRSGGSFPANVHDINPYQCKPENLPDGVWYYVEGNVDAGSSFGRWKLKDGDCKLYSNSSFTGGRASYEYYEGQAPYESKTAWVMQKYWMNQMDLRATIEQKETSSLCKVFLGDEQFQNNEMIQKTEFSSILNSEPILNHQLVVTDGSTSNNMASGSTSKSKMNEDDKMIELADAGKRLDNHLEDIHPEMDYYLGDDYLELLDLDNPTSSSSSSENSSCLSMSSNEDFDTMDVLRDVEREINHDRGRRDAACIHSSAPFKLKKEVVYQVASDSLVTIIRSHPPAKETPKTDSSANMKLPSQSKKEGYRMKGASSSCHNKVVSNGEETGVDGGKKRVGRREKSPKKKYFCFFPL
ncbi:NAC domain-containing protein 30-like [Cucurbita pepo subsp. pepo]|uniref:NAC domain-containing protein 30-like n=1 Tax=Cucurbita pepo subsp. pepo TaxID=3664 RepID=UPI000C9D9F72|nr:NAC domain-containing protein 30-like [Cucurbita pepo subsp. pepo]